MPLEIEKATCKKYVLQFSSTKPYSTSRANWKLPYDEVAGCRIFGLEPQTKMKDMESETEQKWYKCIRVLL